MGATIGLSTIFQVGSGLLGAYSAYAGGKASEAAYKNQAAVADQNARMAEAQADETLSRGAREERQFRQRVAQQAATQESQLAASGAQVSGSALNIMDDTLVGIEEDVTSLRYNVAQQRWGQQSQAVNFRNEASAARASAKNARTAGFIGMGTSLLGTAAKFTGAASPTTASYQAGVGITPRYSDYYNSANNTFGTFTNNNVPEQWWADKSWLK